MTKVDGGEATEELVRLVQRTYSDTMTVSDERALARLEESWHRSQRSRGLGMGGRPRALAMAFAVVAMVAGGTVAYRHFDKLTYEVVNGTIGPEGFVRPTSPGTSIVFSEGSEIVLGESARTRVDGLTPNGGQIIVESGSVDARIVPRRRAHWTVEAGPYTIRVTGTAFNVRWSWADERLDVKMHHGSVVVTGPLAPSGVTLTGGMRLTANPRAGLAIGGGAQADAGSAGLGAGVADDASAGGVAGAHVESGVGEGAAPSNANPNMGPTTADEGVFERTRVASPRQKMGSSSAHRGAVAERKLALGGSTPDGDARHADGWDRMLARGDAEAVLADADARGVDRLLVTVPERDLSALADAARYGHRPMLARRALLTMRDRFPGALGAREAAFFLGGLAEDAPGAGARTMALDWYDHYLKESPNGRYVAQALGRKMVLVENLRGLGAARSLAEQYLDRFPGGPYAAAARKLTRAP